MKISLDRKNLVESVLNVQKAVSTKSCIPALEGILIKTNSDSVSLSGYDLELGIKTEIPAQVIEQGEVIINAKILADIIRKAPSETINVSVDDSFISTVTSNPAIFSLPGISAEEYPKMPTLENEDKLLISSLVLKSMIRQTLFATAETDTKPINTGTLFDIKENELKLVSVDGFRLAIRREALSFEKDMQFVVPGKALTEILKLLPDEDEDIEILIGKKHIIFYIGDYQVTSRLLEGDFLNYKDAIPLSNTTEVVVNVKNLLECIDRVSLMVTDRLKSPIRCLFAENSAKISCITTLGKAKDEMSVTTQGASIEIGFNNRYLMEALKNTECDEVRIHLNGPLSPMKILPLQGNSFTFLVLPVRLRADET